tara:strand:+ start:117 stop:443 length:327 start_codon:yes stop_codon:yes gene_type:complete
MKVYGIKNCDTCKKALSILTEKGFNTDLIDIRDTPLSLAQITVFANKFGSMLINKRSTTWRKLSEEERNLSIEKLLVLAPTVMKRPIIDNGNLFLGWNKEVIEALTVK